MVNRRTRTSQSIIYNAMFDFLGQNQVIKMQERILRMKRLLTDVTQQPKGIKITIQILRTFGQRK